MKKILILIILTLFSQNIFADENLDKKAREINKKIRCVVCQSQSIDDSDSLLAKDLRILIKEKLKEIPIQGGLDPKILLTDKKKIKKSVKNYLNIFSDHPYIFNLGHGVLPNTKPEIIEYVIKIVRDKS